MQTWSRAGHTAANCVVELKAPRAEKLDWLWGFC